MTKNELGRVVADGITVDAILLTPELKVVMIKRAKDPFEGYLALPGGHIEEKEMSRQAVKREVLEEVNLDIPIGDFRLIGIYDKPGRDPRGWWYITHVYFAIVNEMSCLLAKSDAKSVELIKLDELITMPLALDHGEIIKDFYEHPLTQSVIEGMKNV